MRRRRLDLILLAMAVTAAACSGTRAPTADTIAVNSSQGLPDAATAATSASPSITTLSPPPTTTTTAPPRRVTDSRLAPFATVEGVVLFHPARTIERVGFHQSNHDGARQLDPAATAVVPTVMEDRERDTGERTAADIVAHPQGEIRSPVTGTVKRGGTYVLYCKHSDDYVVIEPDARPGWEVKLLHIDGLQVAPGDRVEAGVTRLARRPTQLPFESQVDDLRTAEPAWPHVHLEVVDPSIKDRPTPGGGCN